MADVRNQGTTGTSGVTSGAPGATGTPGGPGGAAGADSNSIMDTTNTAEAYGGNGGQGSSGDPSDIPGQGGGRGQSGGDGGFANASATVSAASSSGNSATATADGGDGGDGGLGGAPSGLSGVGGSGAGASATAKATNTAGAAVAEAISNGGAGGTSQLDTVASDPYTGNLYHGGTGGVANDTTAVADGTTLASATVMQTGGSGGAGGSGGDGASSTLTNAVSGETTGGSLQLTQEATGGSGGLGDFPTLEGASGGTAVSDLILTDGSSHSVSAYAQATGGASGYFYDEGVGYIDNGYGGSAEATSNVTTTETTNYPNGYAFSDAEANGGEGTTGGNATAMAIANGNAAVSVAATAGGGYGDNIAGNAVANATGIAGTDAIVVATADGGRSTYYSGAAQARATGTAVSGSVTANANTDQETHTTMQDVSAAATTTFLQSAVAVSSVSNHGSLAAFDTIDQAVANAALLPIAASDGTDFGTGDTTLIDMELGGGAFASVTSPTTVTADVSGAIDLSAYPASGDLLIGLHDAVLVGTGVTGVELIIEGGVNNSIIKVESFSSGSAALSYFSHDILNFGAIGALSPQPSGYGISFELLVTVDNANSGFYADLQYGIGASATPPPPEIFQDNTGVQSSASVAASYLWSFAQNWESGGVPTNGDSVIMNAASGVDDIGNLSLSSLMVGASADLLIAAPLTLGTLTISSAAIVDSQNVLTVAGSVLNEGIITTDPTTITFDGPVTGNGTIEISAGSDVIFSGSVAAGETIDFLSSTGTLTIDDPSQFAGSIMGTGHVDIACFVAGTRILTAGGELVPIETLRVGDEIETYCGDPAAIIWIGRRRIPLQRHPAPHTVQPVLITAGALGQGLPWRDLAVSPDHALYLDDHLIPAKALINGFSIRQLDCAEVTYFHIELAEHGVLLAEGAPAESYVDTGNRGGFENGGGVIVLHPDFAQTMRVTKSCAPFAEVGPIVQAVRQRILDRVKIATTNDPALKICYEDGAAIIESRSAVPGELTADPRDRRRLGVKIAALQIAGKKIPLDLPTLTDGWHDIEADGRWTNGRAVVPKDLLSASSVLTISLAATLAYPDNDHEQTLMSGST